MYFLWETLELKRSRLSLSERFRVTDDTSGDVITSAISLKALSSGPSLPGTQPYLMCSWERGSLHVYIGSAFWDLGVCTSSKSVQKADFLDRLWTERHKAGIFCCSCWCNFVPGSVQGEWGTLSLFQSCLSFLGDVWLTAGLCICLVWPLHLSIVCFHTHACWGLNASCCISFHSPVHCFSLEQNTYEGKCMSLSQPITLHGLA